MKDYKLCIIRCRCSNEMRKGKLVKAYEYTPEKRKCPNCGEKLKLQIVNQKSKKQKVLITE